MSGRIPPSFIDELLSRVDIVEVIDSRVPLKKAGREYTACCPFHNEKTPSFTVSPDKQFYHCFGCGAHGSALGFLMEYEHQGFVEAVEELASSVGLEIPREAVQAGQDSGQQDLYTVMETAAEFYRQQLRQHPQAARATDYLKGRGLSGEIAAHFELGFAPPGWDKLSSALLDRGVSQDQLIRAGLVQKKEKGGIYDRFRDRIMFPIRDRRGRVVAFGGRQLGDEDGPKYLNSPETAIFHKGRELYGLYQARKSPGRLDRLLVVEGYMDVVALAQFEVKNAVATLGTATTHEHLDRLFRVVPEVVFCFDGDRAGRQAAWRALQNALPVLSEGRQIKFMFLPEGEDPDSLIRNEGKEKFEKRIREAVPFSDYFFAELANTADVSSIDGRARLVEQARPLLDKLPEGVFRHMMTARLAQIAQIDLESLLPGKLRTRSGETQFRGKSAVKLSTGLGHKSPSPVRQAIQLLLYRPSLVKLVKDASLLQKIDLPGSRLLFELVEFLQSNPHLKCGAIVEHWKHREEGRHLAKLASQPVVIPDEGLETEFSAVIEKLASKQHEQTLEGLLAKSQLSALSEEEKALLQQALANMGGGKT